MALDTKTRTILASVLASLVAAVAALTMLLAPDPVPVPAPVPVPVPVPVPAKTGFVLGTQSWFVDPAWSGEKIFSAPGVINPAYVADIKSSGARVFRHMDSNAVNCSQQGADWSKRRLPTDPDQTAYGARDGDGSPGIAYEYQIDLCNAANVDCWFSVPHLSTVAYITSLANLVKTRLKPTLNVYFEFSNEVWNGGFCQFDYALTRATQFPALDKYRGAIAWEMFQTLTLGRAFETVLGVDRVTIVFSESGDYSLTSAALAAVYVTNLVPGVKIDMLAIAPYIYTGNMDGSSFTLDGFKAAVEVYATAKTDSIPAAKAQAALYGIGAVGCYEGGSHYTVNASSAALSASTEASYTFMLSRWAGLFTGACNLYTLHSEYSSSNAWGAMSSTGGDCSKFPKCRALSAWSSSH